MANTYVKNYSVGQIRLDAPYSHFIHELPLLSFGDIQHSINLSLVYQSKMTGNPFYIANGYKLSLQKRIIFSSNGIPEFFEDGNGNLSDLIAFGSEENAVYTFGDNSKRILRKTSERFTLEYPDYSKETYDLTGMITSAYDKYNECYLLFHYQSNKLTSVVYRTNKIVDISYNNNKISSVTYRCIIDSDNKTYTTSFAYSSADKLTSVHHYSGVSYNLYLDISTDTGVTYEVCSTDNGGNYSNDYSQKLTVTTVIGHAPEYNVTRYHGNKIVDQASCSMSEFTNNKFNILDVTNFNGIKNRIQYENGIPAYSYEVAGDMFIENSANHNYLFNGNVNIHNGNTIDGTLAFDDGIKMLYNPYSKQWYYDFLENHDYQGGYYVLTGWIKPTGTDKSCTIDVYDILNGVHVCIPVNNLSSNRWNFFAVRFADATLLEFNIIFRDVRGEIESRDLRITFQQPHVIDEHDNNRLTNTEDVLFISDSAISFNDIEFYNGSTKINQKVTSSDVLKYLLRERKGLVRDEIYYNDCQGIIKSTENLIAKHGDDYYNVVYCSVGNRYLKGSREIVTKYIVDHLETNQTSLVVIETYSASSLVSRKVYDQNLDIASSTVDSVNTVYTRNAKGLITKQSVDNFINTFAEYDVTNTKLIKTINEFGKETTYVTDDTWGVVTSTTFNGSTVTNTYDYDNATVLSRTFSKDSSNKQYQFGYTNGNLTSLTDDALNYSFGYTNENLTEVKKQGNVIENHSFTDNNKTVTSSYPSAGNPLYTVEKKIDNYGRVKEITGKIKNTYSISAKHENGNYDSLEVDNSSGKIALSEDLITHETTKFAYEFDRLSKIGTFNSSNTQIFEERFTHDSINRLTSDEYVYDYSNSKSVRRDIEYYTQTTSPNPDKRVSVYSYKVNGTEKAKTQNRYNDTYKRLTAKLTTIGSVTYDKGFAYDKTRVSKVMDVKNGSTFHNVSYTYDAMGRILSEVDSADASFNNTYVYDAFGRLVQENNKGLDKTFVYEYNEIGNIIGCDTLAYTTENVSNNNVAATHVYDSIIKDRLIKFNNISISYDANGCPTYYNGRSYTWNKGKLSRVYRGSPSQGGTAYEDCVFTYDAYGRRLSKSYTYDPNPASTSDYSYTYNTTYTYDNSGRLVREYCSEKYIGGSTKTRDITYLYDESGIVGAIQKYNSTEEIFYFDKNIKGDVIALYNSSGIKIANYSYDSWGNCTTKTIVANNFSAYNPIRYRGYYFDRETGLYFLNARYYNPEWRRFISPDDTAYLDPETPNGLNLYAYCNNDPVNFSDPSGNSIIAVILITTTLVGATIGGVVSYNQQKETTGKVKFSKMILPIIGGALLGLAAGGLIVGTMGAFYGTYKAITLSKAFADIILYGVGVKQWVASGLLAYNVGSYLGGIIFGVTFEMIEPGTPNINPNQPIIENQPQKYR